jgi:hypothetical protein
VDPQYAGQLVLVKENDDGRVRNVAGTQCLLDCTLARPQQPPGAVPPPTLPAWAAVDVRDLAVYDAATGGA